MGGLGAKSRRRFQREQTHSQEQMNLQKNGTIRRRSEYTDDAFDGKKNNPSKPPQKQSMQHTTNTKSSSSSGRQKLQKPKHLKRKLEQSTDEEERMNVLCQIQLLEQSKEEKKRRRRRRRDHSQDHRPKKRESFAESPSVVTLRKKEEEEIMFPRENITKTSVTPSFVPTRSVDHTVVEHASDENPIDGNSQKDASEVNSNHNTNEPKLKRRRRGRKEKDENNLKDEKSNDMPIVTTNDHDDDLEKKKLGSKSSSDDEEDDVDVSNVVDHCRQRGKRRRGRINTSEQKQSVPVETNAQPDAEPTSSQTSNNDHRYCKGRKPVTDFVVGNTYPAKVVHVKPFGVFFDIGCHSDAFCHVSRLSDEFVSNPRERFHEGDSVHVRVIEIHRTRKQITVSLQSEARIADEHASMMARKERQQKQNGKKKNMVVPKHSHKPVTPNATEAPQPVENTTMEPMECSAASETADNQATSPSDLKRARKLARRAARRAAQQESDVATPSS
jgi:predicted RNA-binding protein with RPS1 domain